MLEDIIEFQQAFLNADLILITIYFAIFAFIIFKWKNFLFRNKKYRSKSLIFALLTYSTIIVLSISRPPIMIAVLILSLLFVLFVVFVISAQGKIIWPCSSINKKFKNNLNSFEPEKAKNVLDRNKWLFLDPSEKYSYYLQLSEYYYFSNDFHCAYSLLLKIDKKELNINELIRLNILKAEYAISLGDFKKSKEILNNLNDINEQYRSSKYLILAKCAYYIGNHDEFIDYLEKANSIDSDQVSSIISYEVLNNLGASYNMVDNYTYALHYYEKALSCAKK